MADSIIQYLVDTVRDLLEQEVNLLAEVKDEVEDLASKLEVINAFLRDSEGKQDENEEVRTSSFAAENQRRNRMSESLNSLNNRASILYTMAEKTDKIIKAITNIYSNFELYNIKRNDGGVNSDPVHLPTKDVVEKMVGRKDEENEITTKLITGRPELEIVSIVGMGGLGKTTLARKIYNDVAIQNHFTWQGWVSVFFERGTRQVLLAIIKVVVPERAPETLEHMSEEELVMLVYTLLESERYLIVLDDIWTREMWDQIGQCFPDGDRCSRIMITTRNMDVARYIRHDSALSLRFLTFEEGWELFSREVFRGETFPPIFQQLGKEIVRKCEGLPLCIVVMAGTLAGSKSLDKWKRTIGNKSLIFAEHETCLKMLALSYGSLHWEVKPCFLYFAAFPQDFEVPARQLIRLWVGEGLIKKSGERPMEDITEDYLNTLIDRNLLQAENFRMDGGVKTCWIHSLLRDLCIVKAEKEIFVQVRKDVRPSTASARKPRRLSVQ